MDQDGWGRLRDQQYLVVVMSQHGGGLKDELPGIYGCRPAASACRVTAFDGNYDAEKPSSPVGDNLANDSMRSQSRVVP